MRRRVLRLCLLAYPRAQRQRDHAYLLDLALDLAERQGLARQALSFVVGGVRERVAQPGRRFKRAAATASALAALALGAGALIAPAEENREVDHFACRATNANDCAGVVRLAAARERVGWDCTTAGSTRHGLRSISWKCTRDA